ncbi:binding--dependent transport system inner membrane component family protein [Mycobacterium xenopi 3993]|nr:binding--dependent transport system inner membrane component family protein [Mycobacterium xenopi 3993]
MTATAEPTVLAQVARAGRSATNRRRARAGRLFVAPNLVAVAVFTLFPLGFSLYMSFQRWDVFTPPKFVGLSNFRNLFTADPLFLIALTNTVVFTLGSVVPTVVISLVVAALLNRKIKGIGLFRTAAFLPLAVSSVVIAVVWQFVFNTDNGLLNIMLGWIGISPIPWLVDPKWAMVSLCLVSVWKSVPFATVVLLAAMQGVPDTLYEAARIDGAGEIRQFVSITVPLIRGAVSFVVVISIIHAFQAFDLVYVLTGRNGGPETGTYVLGIMLFQHAFGFLEFGYASALAWVMFAILLALTVLQLRFARGDPGRWTVVSAERMIKHGVLRGVALYVALTAIAWCALFPILWALSGSLKSEGEVSMPTLLPSHPRWSNYAEVFTLIPLGRMFFNTVLYAGCVTAGQVFFCSLAGYAFARLRFRGRDALFVLYLGTLMVPLTVTVIPQFILMRLFGWTDTPWAMIVPGLFGTAFGTYLMRQFFRTLPVELEEAAILDGCTPWQIYWRILLPHTRPALMVLAVLTWVNVWNDFLWPLVMIQRNSIATLTLGLVRMQGEYVARWPVLMAASMLILLPLVVVYAVAQRSFIRGIAVSGLGG